MNKLLLIFSLTIFLFIPKLVIARNTQQTQKTTELILPVGVKRLTSVEGITEYELPNGLKFLLFPDHSKKVITVNTTYLVGSRHENYGESGMAHLLEHLMFKGTPKHKNIPQELSQRGAIPDATTWLDRTNYFEIFPANQQNLEWAINLEADRMVNSFIAKKDLDTEMTVVRNEFEAGENDPLEVLIERSTAISYLWHNYRKSTIGAKSDIENVAIEKLQAFYRNYYQPDNAVLLIAGNIEESKTLDLVIKAFGSIPHPQRILQKTYTLDPTQDGERSITLRRVGDIQGICALYHIPAGTHSDYAPIEVLTQIFGDVPSGRLHKSLVQTKKAVSVESESAQLCEPGVITFMAQLRREDSIDSAREIFLQTVEGTSSNQITREELERAKSQLLKEIELNLNSSEEIGLELSEWIAMGDWRLLFLHRDRIKKVTLEDVQRVANFYLKSSNRTLGLFIPTAKPDRVEIPSTPNVAELLKSYKSDSSIEEGEVFDSSPENIDLRTVYSELKNGLRLAFLQKKTRGNKVVVNINLRFGDEVSLKNRATTAQLTALMLMRGSVNHTRQQLVDDFDKLKARVEILSQNPNCLLIQIETIKKNLPSTLELISEVLHSPSFSSDEFEQLKRERLAEVESQKDDPENIVYRVLANHLSSYPRGDVRYIPTFTEEISDIKTSTLDQLKSFHKDFYGFSNGELSIVGDFEKEEILQVLDKFFNSWNSKNSYSKIIKEYKRILSIDKSIQVPDKANAALFARTLFNLQDNNPDYPALVLGNYIFGGGFLNSRLATRIRQKEGLSYDISSSLKTEVDQPVSSLGIFAICAPQNISKVESAIKEELEKVVKDGFTKEEVEAAKAGYLQIQSLFRSNDAFFAYKLGTYRSIDRRPIWDAGLEKKINSLQIEDVNLAFRKCINLSNISFVKAGSF